MYELYITILFIIITVHVSCCIVSIGYSRPMFDRLWYGLHQPYFIDLSKSAIWCMDKRSLTCNTRTPCPWSCFILMVAYIVSPTNGDDEYQRSKISLKQLRGSRLKCSMQTLQSAAYCSSSSTSTV